MSAGTDRFPISSIALRRAKPPAKSSAGGSLPPRPPRRCLQISSSSTASVALPTDGREYVTVLGPGQSTPAPWINVVANPSFGFQVGTEGGGTRGRSTARRIISPPGRTILSQILRARRSIFRDDATGDLWCPTARPIRNETGNYIARHGRGYSRFEHTAHDIEMDLLQFVPLEDPIKISRLRFRNLSKRTRHLSVTAYAEWVLGPSRAASGSIHYDGDRCRHRSHVCPQCVEWSLRISNCLRRSTRGADRIGLAIGGSSSAGMARSPIRQRSPAQRSFPKPLARGSILAEHCGQISRLKPNDTRRGGVLPRPGCER